MIRKAALSPTSRCESRPDGMTARPVPSMFGRKYRSIAAIAASPVPKLSAKAWRKRHTEAAPTEFHAHSYTVGSLPSVARWLLTSSDKAACCGRRSKRPSAPWTQADNVRPSAWRGRQDRVPRNEAHGTKREKSKSFLHGFSHRYEQVITGDLPSSEHRQILMRRVTGVMNS